MDNKGNVYVGTLEGSVISLTSAGKLRWRRKVGERVFASPTLGPDGIFIGSDSDVLVRLRPSDGTVSWTFRLGPCDTGPGLGPDSVRCDGDGSALAVQDGSVFYGADALYAVTPEGQQRWRAELGAHAFSSPAQGPDGALYIGTQANTVVSVSAAGERRWEFKGKGDFDATPALVSDDLLVAGCDDGRVYALATKDGSLKWQVYEGRAVRSSAALDRQTKTVLFGSDRGRLVAVDAATGDVRWRYVTGGRIRSSPVVDPDGRIVFGSQDNHLYAVSRDGKLLWSVDLGGDVDSSVGVAADGTLYIGADDGNLYALR